MTFTKFALAAAALTLPAAALAQADGLVEGATVYGPQGNPVGTIDALDGGNVVVNTGTYTATLAGSAFATSEQGPVISMTKAQLNAAIAKTVEKADERLDAALVAGAPLRGMNGAALGTIASVGEDGLVTVDREEGGFALEKANFSVDDQGLVLNMSEADLEAALAKTE